MNTKIKNNNINYYILDKDLSDLLNFIMYNNKI